MKYYAGHENTYRRIEAEGASCWDRTAFDAFYMRPFSSSPSRGST